MTAQAPLPKRIADYFFMVGLSDDFCLTDEQQGDDECTNARDDRIPDAYMLANDSSVNDSSASDSISTAHSSLFQGDTTSDAASSTGAAPTALTALTAPATKPPTRARSKSMAQTAVRHTPRPPLPSHDRDHDHDHDDPQPRRSVAPHSGTDANAQRPTAARRSTAVPAHSNRHARRSATMSDISHKGAAAGGPMGLQHKPSYRHVSAGTLYRTVQEGIQRELKMDTIRDYKEKGRIVIDGIAPHTSEIKQAGPVDLHNRHDPNPATAPPLATATTAAPHHENAASLSVQDMKNLAFGKNMAMIRSRSKIVQGTLQHGHAGMAMAAADADQLPPDTHPAERFFSPAVTSRYPETDWEDAEAFPPHLPMFCFPGELSFRLQEDQPATTYHSFVMTQETGNRSYAMCVTIYERLPKPMQRQFNTLCQKWTKSQMSESELEYAKAIKTKISREKALHRSLRRTLREERTLGRQARIQELKREIMDSEETLMLLEDQMQPWRRLFVEADDVWIPRCIGLVSAVPYHYLLRDWLLAVVVACSGGVEHPGMSLSSLRLERYVRNIIHDVSMPPFGKMEIGITVNNRVIYASRPALNSVPIVKNFSLFPLFRCISPEDVVTLIEVMLSEGKIVFVSSYLGMLTLASESILYLFFPLYWQGVYIPILPAALMTCLQAPVPYIIGVERSCCESDFPPEDACVVDLDKGTIKVQLAPVQLPPRPRKKLVQSLEQYAPVCMSRRSAISAAATAAATNSECNDAGPPKYVQEAYPHSRLTLFCGVSRAPRSSRRSDSQGYPATSIPSAMANAMSDQITSPSASRRSSINTLGQPILSTNALPKIPKVDFEKETLMEGMGERKSRDSVVDDQGRFVVPGSSGERNTAQTLDSRELRMNKVAPDQDAMDSFSIATRKVLSPQRARVNVFEMPKKQDSTTQQQLLLPTNTAINRSNLSLSTHLSASDVVTGKLSHRGSVTSIDSSNSSAFQRPISASGPIHARMINNASPVSTMTSNTMGSINGPSPGVSSSHLNYSSSSTSSLPPLVQPVAANINSGGVDFVEEEVEREPSPFMPIAKEGHVLVSVSNPASISLLNCRCGICSLALASHQQVYRCEECSLFVHAGCIEELLYPCVPHGFDESGICWSVLQMWAGLLKGYRSGILAGQALQQQQIQQQIQMQMQMHIQNQSPRGAHHHGQSQGSFKQPSSGSSDGGAGGEKDGRDRFSWASFRGWTSRNSSTTSANIPAAPLNNRGSGGAVSQTMDQAQSQQQPQTRSRRGTNCSVSSDTVRFHRDVFMKGVDKEARPFMSAFAESQAFVQFVQDRVDRSPGDPEIMFFDEVIKAKINRSRFRLGKEDTKFLDDPSYGIQGTVKAVAPAGEPHRHGSDSRRFPITLDPAYL